MWTLILPAFLPQIGCNRCSAIMVFVDIGDTFFFGATVIHGTNINIQGNMMVFVQPSRNGCDGASRLTTTSDRLPLIRGINAEVPSSNLRRKRLEDGICRMPMQRLNQSSLRIFSIASKSLLSVAKRALTVQINSILKIPCLLLTARKGFLSIVC